MTFKNLPVLGKILSVVLVLGVIMGALSGVSINALGTLNDTAERIELAGTEAALASRLVGNTMALSRAEFALAADPSAAGRAEAAQTVAAERASFEDRLQRLLATATGNQVAQLNQVADTYRTYLAGVEQTLAVAARVGDGVTIDDNQRAVLAAVREGEALAGALRQQVYGFAQYTDQRAATLAEEAATLYGNLRTLLIAGSAGGILLGLLLGFLVAQFGIAKPIGRIVALLRKLAENDTSVTITDTDRKDEVGTIAKTAEVFKQNIERTRQLEAEQEEAERQAEERQRQAMNALADEFEGTVKSIVGAVASAADEMQASAQSLSSIAEETNRQSMAVAAAAEQASTNVETVASAAEELSGSISEINRQVTDATRVANEAVANVERTNATVAGLAEGAQRIGDVVKLIQAIAEQTNLLALNATIEAARAGEAGKGFAVVASEVKNLATQTAKATDEIAGQIAGMQSVTGEAVTAIQGIGASVSQVNEMITGIASAAEQQGAATQEIARNVQQASAGTREVSSNIGGVTQAATETGSMASQVLSASGELSQQASTLSTEVDAFIAKVRDSA